MRVPVLSVQATVGLDPTGGMAVRAKGALETVLPSCTHVLVADSRVEPLTDALRAGMNKALDVYAQQGLRVLAVARRDLDVNKSTATRREDVETGLTMVGLVAMADPPREGVREAVALAHQAGVRIHVITGDHGLTAAEIARRVGIGTTGPTIIDGVELEQLSDADLAEVLSRGREIVFARTAPEGKLRICQALRGQGDVVAMTGDGVNDAPALRHADIGIAMGRSGTDVAREAANHGADGLWRAGWTFGDQTGTGAPLHHAYLQATTITFVGIVACQIGTAFAARTDRASMFTIGIFSNRLLLWGIAFELEFTAAVVYLPPAQHIFGTSALTIGQLAVVVPFRFIVWRLDELVRTFRRRPHRAHPQRTASAS